MMLKCFSANSHFQDIALNWDYDRSSDITQYNNSLMHLTITYLSNI